MEMLIKSLLVIHCAKMVNGWAIAPSVSFMNLDAEIDISDQLVTGRTVYTFETSDDDETSVTMTSPSPYFEIDMSDDKLLVTKSCLVPGTYALDFTATDTDGYDAAGTLTVNVINTAPIFNNLPFTVSQIISNCQGTSTIYTLNIDMGCVTDYSTVCDLSASPSLSVALQDQEIQSSHGNKQNIYRITVTCTVNGRSSSGTLTLNLTRDVTTFAPTTVTSSTVIATNPTSLTEAATVTLFLSKPGSSTTILTATLSSDTSSAVSEFFDFGDPVFVAAFSACLVLLVGLSIGTFVLGWRCFENIKDSRKSKATHLSGVKQRSTLTTRKIHPMNPHIKPIGKMVNYPRHSLKRTLVSNKHRRINRNPANRNSRFSPRNKVNKTLTSFPWETPSLV